MKRYFGLIDWFGTADGGKYGFIKYKNNDISSEWDSIFLHKNDISKPSKNKIDQFSNGQVVVFSIKESDTHRDRVCACDVLLLGDESYQIILDRYLSYDIFLLQKDSLSKKIETEISARKSNLIEFNYLIVDFIKPILLSDSGEKISIVLKLFDMVILENKKLIDIIFSRYFNYDIYQKNNVLFNFVVKNKNLIVDYGDIFYESMIKSLENCSDDFIKIIFDNFREFIIDFDIINSLNDNTRIKLWFFDFYNDLDVKIESLKNFVSQLDNDEQRIFFKKIFYGIKIKLFNFDFNDLLLINFTDYSTKVILELMNKLTLNQKFNQNALKDDILRAISNADLVNCADDVLKLDGYFNLCAGRCVEQAVRDQDGNIIDYELRIFDNSVEFISDINRRPIVCDGRLSNGISDGGRNFWWCKNKKCFKISRITQEDWENYTIIDFLEILKIPYQNDTIEILYGLVNRVNRFLEHLNCKSCKKLLKPDGNSNYTFYRVSTFSCKNPECINPDKSVYISHCSNGHCDGTIDSRNAKRCDNNFVICNKCFACCSQELLNRRNENRLINKLGLVAWNPPHKGNDILCPKCASSMVYQNIHQVRENIDGVIGDFERLLQLDVLDNEKLVTNTGVNNGGKRWFVVWRRHYSTSEFNNFLYDWQALGFDIVDFPENLTKNNYLVVEPSNNQNLLFVTQFNCNQCGASYNTGDDKQRCRSIRYWHSSELNPI